MSRVRREFARYRQEKGRDGEGQFDSLASDARRAFLAIAHRLAMGGRAITRTVRIARTIADIEHHDFVTKEDIVEACTYRGRNNG